MLYKELLDAMLLPANVTGSLMSSDDVILPTETPFSFSSLWLHLNLNPDEPVSEDFVRQSRAVVLGNGLRFGAGEARTLTEMVRVWQGYVLALGLGSPGSPTPAKKKPNSDGKDERNLGCTEERLELVYRRAGPAKDREKKRKGKRRKEDESVVEDEETLIQLAIERSLAPPTILDKPPEIPPERAEYDPEQEGDELAWAVEMSLGADVNGIAAEEGGEVILRASQRTVTPSSSQQPPSSPLKSASQSRPQSPESDPETTKPGTSSGSIIGKHRFTHSPRLLAAHLDSVLAWWLGQREAVGVGVEETRRCGWCEFEEGCEWR